jgi:hypothetical protein
VRWAAGREERRNAFGSGQIDGHGEEVFHVQHLPL